MSACGARTKLEANAASVRVGDGCISTASTVMAMVSCVVRRPVDSRNTIDNAGLGLGVRVRGARSKKKGRILRFVCLISFATTVRRRTFPITHFSFLVFQWISHASFATVSNTLLLDACWMHTNRSRDQLCCGR